jgi:hypothetical protein
MDELGYTTALALIEEEVDEQNTLNLRREDGLGHLQVFSDGTRARFYAGLRTEAPGVTGDQTTIGLELTPEGARQLAEALLEAADEADRAKGHDALLWNEEP